MKITEAQLRQIVKSELFRLHEAEKETAASQEGAAGLSDQQKKKLKAFAASPPSNLSGFATSMKTLGGILGEIDEKAANLNGGQIKMYFTQIMEIVDSMMSDKKTSSSETAKVAKAVGG